MQDLMEAVIAQEPEIIALRRELHMHPELGLQEYNTAARIEKELDSVGIEHWRVGKTGVLGRLRGTGAGAKTVALRADIDALPIQERTGVPYASCEAGRMHACGHDMHTAMLLSAAKLLAARRERFGGEIRLFFQAAEEIGKGALDFVHADTMDGVERVFGMHIAPDLPLGTVGVKPGVNNAAVDAFTITVHGKSAHVSAPQLGVDALYIASHIVVGIQAQVTRRTSPVEPLLVGIGTLHAGDSYNIVAETAIMQGTTRTCSAESRALVRRLVEATAQNIAAAYGGTAEVQWQEYASVLVNDEQVCGEVKRLIEAHQPDWTVQAARPLSLGGDDFAEYQLKAPGAYAYLGTTDPDGPQTTVQLHNERFLPDERALRIGTWLYAAYPLWYLGGH